MSLADEVEIRFSQGVPEGYRVLWVESLEHYMAVGPDEWESAITCDRWQARRWAVWQSRKDQP